MFENSFFHSVSFFLSLSLPLSPQILVTTRFCVHSVQLMEGVHTNPIVHFYYTRTPSPHQYISFADTLTLRKLKGGRRTKIPKSQTQDGVVGNV